MKKPLNIALIAGDLNPNDLGGAEIHIVEVIKGLAEKGHTVHVFLGNDTKIKAIFPNPNIHCHAIKYAQIKNLYSVTYTRAAIKQIGKFLKANPDIDLIHAKAVFPFGMIGGRLAKTFKLPFYLTVQNPVAYKEELVLKTKLIPQFIKNGIQEILKPTATYSLKRCDLAACVSKYSEDKSKLLGAKRTAIVPNGFDQKRFQPHPNQPKNEFWITTTSTLIPRNGIDTLVEGFGILSSSHDNIRLKIAGEGPMRPMLDNLVKKYDIADKVEFLGTLRHDEIPKLLNKSHLFVRPSRFEGFGVSFIEAMACGIPVVTCPRGGITDFVTQDVTGKLVEPDDPSALSHAMNELIENPDKREQLANAAQKLVNERYNWSKIVDNVENLYYSIAAS
jgi:phosphatidylinositol alpha-1,6-mannosyltransferase